MAIFIFDIDGTLLNTIDDIAYACNTALERNGYSHQPVEIYKKLIGSGFKHIFKELLRFEAPQESWLEQLAAEAWRGYQENMMRKTTPYVGIPEILEYLAARGTILAVYSDKPDTLTKIIISRYFPEIPFVYVRGRITNEPRKPNPEVLLNIIRRLGAYLPATFYVGDTGSDMLAANAAGVGSLGAAWGFGGRRELEENNASFIAECPADILTIRFSFSDSGAPAIF